MAWRKYLQEPDEALAAQYGATGDERAFNAIYAQHYPRILAICRRILRNEADAEDVTQGVFLKLSVHIQRFDNGNFAAWIGTIARHESINHLQRACARHERRSLEDLPESAGARGPEVPDFDLIDALNELKFVQRASLKLFYGMGLSCEETARRLGVSAGKVRSAIQNGKANLRKKLEGRPKVAK
jgi:RNA polymerase sigma-70 factor (ECF subfamily)